MSGMALRPRLKGLVRDRRGGAIVEFALVVPFMVVLVCGVAEFGLAFREYQAMQKAVRDAGRFLARGSAAGCSAAEYEAVLATWPNPGEVPVQVAAVDCDLPGGMRGEAVVTVRSEVDYGDVDLGLLALLELAPPTLRVEHQQLVIGA